MKGEGWKKGIYSFSNFLNIIASIILFLMMLLTVTDVFLRKVLAKSILGTVEITEFMMLIIVFFALGQAEIEDKHVRVHLIVSRFKDKMQHLIDMVTQIFCLILFIIALLSAISYAFKMKVSGEVSQDLWIPLYPFIYVVVVGCTIVSIVLLVNFLKAMKKVLKR